MAYRVRRRLSSSVQVNGDENEDYQKWHRSRKSRNSSNTDTSVSRRGLPTSVTAFFSKLRLSKHPERSLLTLGHNDVQSGLDKVKAETTSKCTPETGEVYESDIIPAEFWNTPIPIPRRTHSLTNNSRVLRKPLPISSTGQLQANYTSITTDPRQPSVTNGLAFDGASNSSPRKPPSTSTIGPTSSTPPRRSNNYAPESARQPFIAKEEARRQRRRLRESEDFLGVTGFNPHTGEWDRLTQSTSSGEGSTDQHLTELAQKAQEARAAYELAKKEAQAKREQRKRESRAKRKGDPHIEQYQIKWRREERQWSSAAEPRLSPIPQSRKTSGAARSNDSTPVKPEHVSFLEPGAAPQTAEIARCRQTSRETTEIRTPLGTKSTNSQPIPQSKRYVPVIETTRRVRKIRFTAPPTIPPRLGPSQQDTSPPPLEESASRGTQIGLELKNKNPAERWASNLLQDLNTLEKCIKTDSKEMEPKADSIVQDIGGLETAIKCVCTPITTITGSEQSPQTSNACGERDATSQATLPKAVSTSEPTTSCPSETSMNKNSCSSPLAFQAPKQPSASLSLPNLPLQPSTEPKSDEATAKHGEAEEPKQAAPNRPPSPSSGPDADTTSPHPRTATNGLEKPFHAAWLMRSRPEKEMRKTMRANENHQSPSGDNKSAPTSTSMESPSQPSNSILKSTTKLKLMKGVQAGEEDVKHLNQAIAKEAARRALASHVPQSEAPQPASGKEAVSEPKDDKVNHGVDEETGGADQAADQAGTSSGVDGGDRGAAKTVMGAEAGHDDGHADLAGTVSWGPLLTALFGAASGDNDYNQAGRWLVVIGALPQKGEQQNTEERQSLPPLLRGDMVLLPEATDTHQQPQDGAWDDCMPVRLRKVVSLVRQLVSTYWDLVRPAFDADSPLRQRLQQREQVTVQDYGICVLALLFLILAASAGAWTIRITMEVFRLIGVLTKAILRVILALAGFV